MELRHQSPERVRALLIGAVLVLVAALLAAVSAWASGGEDRLELATETPARQRALVPGADGPDGGDDEATTTTTAAAGDPTSTSTTRRSGSGHDGGDPDKPAGGGDGATPRDEPPPEPEQEVAHGTLWTVDNPPPLHVDYDTPRGEPALLQGTVRTTAGLPLAGMCVRVWNMTGDGHLHPLPRKTDLLGQFTASVPNGRYATAVTDCRGIVPGHAPTLQHIAVAPGQRGELDLRVADGAGLRITVTHQSGAPRAGWCVQQVHESVITGIGALGGVRTGPDGVALVGGLQPGRSRIVVSEDCDWAGQLDGSASEYVDLAAGRIGELHLAPWTCTTLGPGHLSCVSD